MPYEYMKYAQGSYKYKRQDIVTLSPPPLLHMYYDLFWWLGREGESKKLIIIL